MILYNLLSLVFISTNQSDKNCFLFYFTIVPPGEVILVSNYTGVYEISLKWKSPDSDGGSSVISYNIKLTERDKDKDVTRESTNMASFRKKNLIRNTGYTFCIQARNIVGNGKERCINLTTLEEGNLYMIHHTCVLLTKI